MSNTRSMALTQTTTHNPSNLLAPKSTTTPAAPAAPSKRVRPYKDFLTPALHRRFSYAAALVFAVCFLESMLMHPSYSLWVWWPISTRGIRALLLFLPCLGVFIIRVANLHCGELIDASPAHSVWTRILQWRGLHTLGWYLYSAFFFGEVYIWSRNKSAHLGWVDEGREGDRQYVNENPIFLRAFLGCLAVAQTVLHLSIDYDQVPIPSDPQIRTASTQQQSASWLPRSIGQLQVQLPTLLVRTARLVLPGSVFIWLIYLAVLRHFTWSYFYAIAHILFPRLDTQTYPTGFKQIPTLMWQCWTSGAMLVLLWELSSAAFTIYVSRSPLGKSENEPLTGLITTSDKSRDPNESLISGLKSKKEPPRVFAFWELALICAQYDVRRKTIYSEVDRAGGSTWAQISKLCLDEISTIADRISAAQRSVQASPTLTETLLPSQPQPQNLSLPRIADRSVQNGDVWTKPRPDFAHSVGNIAKSFGQHSGSGSPLVPRARQAIEWSTDHVLSKDSQALLTRDHAEKALSGWVTSLLSSPVGQPFRSTFANHVKAVIFGSPSKQATIMHASQALSALCSHSLKEDDYGQVAKTVAVIIRTYTDTIRSIEGYVSSTSPPRTDVYFNDQDRNIADVQELVTALKKGLEEVVLVFGEYASSVGVTKKELREAKDLVGTGQQMTTAS